MWLGRIFILSLLFNVALAADMKPLVKDGSVETLKAAGKDFYAAYKPSTDPDEQGGVLIVAGRDQTINSASVVDPLRRMFPKYGWSTLVISLPDDLPKTNDSPAEGEDVKLELPESVKTRIDAGLAFLQNKKLRKTFILGYGVGGAWVASYAAAGTNAGAKAVVLVSPYLTNKALRKKLDQIITEARIPILEIVASQDFANVLLGAAHRQQLAAAADNKNYEQYVVMGTDHAYVYNEAKVIRKVRGWVKDAL